MLGKISFYAGRCFALWIVLAAAVGWIVPAAFSWVGPNIPLLLGLIMFGMGMTLSPEDFRALLVRPWHVACGVIAQYTVMPALAFLMVLVFGLPAELAIGVILVGTCPGGTASNVLTFLARGDVALSVAITSVSTLLSPILTPVLTLWLAGAYIDVDMGALFVSIVKIVIVPIALGVLMHRLLGARVAPLTRILPLVSVIAIALIVAFVIGANAARLPSVSWPLAGAVIGHNGLGLLMGYLVALMLGMAVSQRKALCFEVGMQNSGLAVALASLHFNPLAALPGALFSVWHNVSGPVLATYWTWRESADGRARRLRAQ